MKLLEWLALVLILLSLAGCGADRKKENVGKESTLEAFKAPIGVEKSREAPFKAPNGMVWIPGGTFLQGAVEHDKMAMAHEKPAHLVKVDGFFMDINEVTNEEYSRFVEATGYVTVAERQLEWEELKKQLPQGTPRPHDSLMQPGSLTFKKTDLRAQSV